MNALRLHTVQPRDGRHDIDIRVMEIWRSAVGATHDFLDPGDFIAIERELTAFFPSVPLTLASSPGGDIAGFMLITGAHMDALFVDPRAHGCGVGRALVMHALQQHPGLTTDVNAQNRAALGFYLHLGFEPVGSSPQDGQGRPYPLIHMRHLAVERPG